MATYLITGHRGFIFKAFTQRLLNAGHHVIGIDCLNYAADKEYRFEGNIVEHFIDVNDMKELPACDVLIIAHAESHVDNSIAKSDPFIESNIKGTHHVLELLKDAKLKNMSHGWAWKPPLTLYVSTDEVFGDIENGHFSENDRHMPSNPYAASKSAAEMLVRAWGRTYGLPYVISRCTNVYGMGQHHEKLIPHAIRALGEGRRVKVHGNGSYIRNWTHIEDACDAFETIIEKGVAGEAYHISTDDELSVRQVVELICMTFGVNYDDSIDSSSDRSGADVRYALDSSKLRALGWSPKRTFARFFKLAELDIPVLKSTLK